MAKRLALSVLSVLTIFLVAGLGAAHAADPAFCKQYARAALNQVHGGLADPGCARGLQGERWSTDFAVHYEWCLGASVSGAGSETDARTRLLHGCAGHG